MIALATFRDYGLGWDDLTHSQYGALLLSFYGSGFRDTRAFSFVNLYMYGGGFDMAAALLAKILPFDLFETRRLLGAAVGITGLFAVWRIGRRVGGPLAGLIALALLASCPLYYGHMFINSKDAPFAVMMAITLLGMVRAIEEYPQPRPSTVLLFGLGIGLAIGSRIMGGFAVLYALAALAFIFIVEYRNQTPYRARVRIWGFVRAIWPSAVVALAAMAVVWPWSVLNPLNLPRTVGYFSHFFEKPWHELFGGELILAPEMPRSYVPTLFALTLPEILLALSIGGLAGAIALSARGDVPVRRRVIHFVIALAAATPIAVAVITRPAMYNGIRVSARGGSPARPRRICCCMGGADRGARGADRAHGAAAPLRIRLFQPVRRRGSRRERTLHARLLGALVQTGLAGSVGLCGQGKFAAAGRAKMESGRLRAASAGRRHPRRAVRADVGTEGRRFRDDARRVLLRKIRRAGYCGRAARRRAVRARL
jgi:hypothetical protein